jgi:hypothetical protein
MAPNATGHVAAPSHNPWRWTAICLAFGAACLIAAAFAPSAILPLASNTLVLGFCLLLLFSFLRDRDILGAAAWGHRLVRAASGLTLFALAWRILAESSFAERLFG